MYKIGDRVGHGGGVINRARDWMARQAEHSRKQRAREALEQCLAERGTVAAILPDSGSLCGARAGLEIHWDNGGVSRCLPHMVRLVDSQSSSGK